MESGSTLITILYVPYILISSATLLVVAKVTVENKTRGRASCRRHLLPTLIGTQALSVIPFKIHPNQPLLLQKTLSKL
jgi:hypothetical protein